VHLNFTFHFDSLIGLLTLLTIIDIPLFHITAVGKHNCRLIPLWRVHLLLRSFWRWHLHPKKWNRSSL